MKKKLIKFFGILLPVFIGIQGPHLAASESIELESIPYHESENTDVKGTSPTKSTSHIKSTSPIDIVMNPTLKNESSPLANNPPRENLLNIYFDVDSQSENAHSSKDNDEKSKNIYSSDGKNIGIRDMCLFKFDEDIGFNSKSPTDIQIATPKNIQSLRDTLLPEDSCLFTKKEVRSKSTPPLKMQTELADLSCDYQTKKSEATLPPQSVPLLDLKTVLYLKKELADLYDCYQSKKIKANALSEHYQASMEFYKTFKNLSNTYHEATLLRCLSLICENKVPSGIREYWQMAPSYSYLSIDEGSGCIMVHISAFSKGIYSFEL